MILDDFKRVAGLLPIPPQTWNSKSDSICVPVAGDEIKPENNVPAPSSEINHEMHAQTDIEPGSQGEQPQTSKSNGDAALDCEEEIAIRRVGFIFLAYNVEFW